MSSILRRGSVGPQVRELQAALNFHIRAPAKPLEPDGKFGPATDARVREFQRRARIQVDGNVGSQTMGALNRKVAGVVAAQVTPHRSLAARPGVSPLVMLNRIFPPSFTSGQRLNFGEGTAADVPVKPSTAQAQAASSDGFDLETKFTFNPLAKPSKGEHPFRLEMTLEMPWPVFLPEPLELSLESSLSGPEKFELEGKIKLPFKLIQTPVFVLKPYFFVGGGTETDHFKDLNAGAGAKVKLKLFKNIFDTGASLSLEADAGGKVLYKPSDNTAKLKGYVEGGLILTLPFSGF